MIEGSIPSDSYTIEQPMDTCNSTEVSTWPHQTSNTGRRLPRVPPAAEIGRKRTQEFLIGYVVTLKNYESDRYQRNDHFHVVYFTTLHFPWLGEVFSRDFLKKNVVHLLIFLYCLYVTVCLWFFFLLTNIQCIKFFVINSKNKNDDNNVVLMNFPCKHNINMHGPKICCVLYLHCNVCY